MKYHALLLLVATVSMASVYAYSPNTHMITPVKVFGKTYNLQANGTTYDIYYGFDVVNTIIEKITLVPEQNTMHLDLSRSNQSDSMWMQFPQAVISADKNNFVLYIDGQEKKYELAVSDHSTVMGFVVPANSTSVDIQGTRIVPEFPTAIIIATLSFVIVIYSTRFIK